MIAIDVHRGAAGPGPGVRATTLGVAIAVPDPFGAELEAWRERLGDPLAHAVPAHITLVPPTRVAADDLLAVERHLAAVAAGPAPFQVRLRGTGTFRPISPVVFVALAEGISGCEQLQDAVRTGPLDVPLRFPYHPHVTVAHDVPEPVLAEAFDQLADYHARFVVDRFHLYEHGADGIWRPRCEFPLGGAGAGS